ncbi:o-succinylbenzoate--CoA ligase [Lacicoccus alkaliphilus]|uniref:2-succinylbenzoate--CoA ligase n=1 Tax=Lacicoccus alkaliphilus DSM 16010 TaxID=1123231 RepID=A0A1M7ADT7_9BACL|nr:o-succinylbenzoate--CoA ligase [Salinicoccus alkaliphilus]SHL40827.1 O-succinylbenzoic acid--CoA ligase [Salinicoccus alkaliphilus DSM 16010]
MENWLKAANEAVPDKVAVKFNSEMITYEALYEEALLLAGKIKTLGEHRMGVFIYNSLDSLKLIHAMIQARVEIVFINTRLTHHEITAQLHDVGVTTIIAAKPLEIEGFEVIDFRDLYEWEPVELEEHPIRGDDVLSIMFTSGTTGRAKAVKQTYSNHYASAKGCETRFGYSVDSVWMQINPIFHISGLSIVLRSVIAQCTNVLVERFEEEKILNLLEDEKVTHTSLVPVMLQRLLKCSNDFGPHLQGILLGGAGVTKKVLKEAIDHDLPVYNSFGMTETCSQIVSVPYSDPNILNGTVGKALENVELKVDGAGELLVKAENVSPGYLNAEMERVDGYFKTGDLARIDEAGYLHILDRRSDLIISGGENIYPKEIEDRVHEVDGVESCVVIKVQDAQWGEAPVLLVQGGPGNEGDILRHLSKTLARYKMPREIHFVDEVIMTSTGKVSRRKNHEQYMKNHQSGTPD